MHILIFQTDYRRHVWNHTGERPIKCDFPNCTSGFFKKSELQAHKSRAHPQFLSQQQQYQLYST